ncbi:AMIN-like domain-containing (lipo)protein [Micromonospora schwarzwaldensis]|uniref:AMIN-like domain-containing (lipo)protein n=1 Tax=Micromonospora sp. DSM 45708 TaxID=3111767 RepID=UPI0031DDDA78
MTLQRVPLLAGLVVLLAAACTTTGHDGAPPAPPTTTPATASAPAATTAAAPPPAATRPASTDEGTAGSWRVTWGWGVPGTSARVTHPVRVPVTTAPGASLPVLVAVQVGDHPAEGFSRITFAFRGPTPSYRVGYVPQVVTEGRGAPVELPGTSYLSVRFSPAQAHDARGGRTADVPPAAIGFPTLLGWAAAGDFEGHLSFGLGLRTPDGGPVPVRLGESTRPDGAHVVSVDVRRG